MPLADGVHPESSSDERPLTRLLHDIGVGDAAAANVLFAIVYDHLRAIAGRRMARERTGHTLQTTALVHEAYAKLFPAEEGRAAIAFNDRRHFFNAAAEAMRRILVDHARHRAAGVARSVEGSVDGIVPPRHGPRSPAPLPENVLDLSADDNPDGILALDEALERFQKVDGQAAQVVRLRFFAGLTVDEAAEALGCSARTVLRDWEFARAWLADALPRDDDDRRPMERPS